MEPNSRISCFWPARNGIVVSKSKKAISERLSSEGVRPTIVNAGRVEMRGRCVKYRTFVFLDLGLGIESGDLLYTEEET